MRLLISLLIVLTISSCRSKGATPEIQYQRILNELKGEGGMRGLLDEGRESLEEMYVRVEGWAADGTLKTPQDQMWAAASLLQAESPERVELAQKLAVKATLGGESRAKVIMAQAMDKSALQAGRPQPFGTQYVFEGNPGMWVLYRIDPKTTDSERAEVGLPPLSQLHEVVRRMNDARQKEFIDWAEEQHPGQLR